jgi:CheY-like chemotaxis protein
MAPILCIDDEESVRRLCQIALEGGGVPCPDRRKWTTRPASLGHQEVDLILVDIFMPDMDGHAKCSTASKTRPACAVLSRHRWNQVRRTISTSH